MIPQGSIRVKFIVGLVLVITGVVLTFSIALITYNTNTIEKQLERQLQRITAFTQDSLSIALWQYNHDYIAKYVDSLFLYEDVVFASILDNDTPVREKSLSQQAGKPFSYFQSSSRFLTSEAAILYDDVPVGTMQVALSRERVTELMVTTSTLSIVVLLVVNCAVFLVLYLLSTRYIFSPLVKLEKSVQAISAGKLSTPIDTSGGDEIGQLATSFKRMMENLQRMTASRDELNHEIQERKKTERRISLLNTLKESLLGPGNINEKLLRISQSVIDILGADFCRIWLIRPGDLCDSPCRFHQLCYPEGATAGPVTCLHLLASSGRYTHINGSRKRIPLGFQKIGQLASGGEANYYSNAIFDDPRFEDHGWLKELQLDAFAGYQLFSRENEPIGVMALFSQKRINAEDNEILLNIAATASDVVQAAETREQLIASERKFRNLFENAQVGMYRSRVEDGKVMESNQRMAEIFEYDSPQECIDNYVAIEHYVDPLARKEIVERLLDDGFIANQIIQIRTNKDNLKWIQFSGALSVVEGAFEGVAIDITDQKLAEDKVQASLEEKEVLIKEIHHRVKNNMQIIQSLLSLQANEVEDAEVQRLLLDSNSRIRSMALIHEILYQAEDMSRLDLARYFESIVTNLSKIYQDPASSVAIDIKVQNVEMGMDLCIACGLVINELVTNAYKYGLANREKGSLLISLEKGEDDFISLVVADDGPGFPENFAIMDTESLGLKIVKILVIGQLKGELAVISSLGGRVEIRFPLRA